MNINKGGVQVSTRDVVLLEECRGFPEKVWKSFLSQKMTRRKVGQENKQFFVISGIHRPSWEPGGGRA